MDVIVHEWFLCIFLGHYSYHFLIDYLLECTCYGATPYIQPQCSQLFHCLNMLISHWNSCPWMINGLIENPHLFNDWEYLFLTSNLTPNNKFTDLTRIVTSKQELYPLKLIFLHKKHENRPPNQKVVLPVAPFFQIGSKLQHFSSMEFKTYIVAQKNLKIIT